MFDQFRRRIMFSRQMSRQATTAINRRRSVQRRTSPFARIPIECGEPLENRLLLSGTNCSGVEPIQLENTTPDQSRNAVTADSTPTIAWNNADSNITYDVWVNEVGVAARQLFATELTDAEFTPDEPLDEGLYRFFIRAEFADGTFGDWSAPYDVTVTTSEAINRSFADSLTWIPQTDFDQFLTTDEPVIQIILPDSTEDLPFILPESQPEPVMVVSSLPPVTEPTNPREADKEPDPGLAEANPDTIDAHDADDPMDARPKPAEPKSDAAKPNTPNDPNATDGKTPPVERIVEEPNSNRTVLINSPVSHEMTIVSALDFDSSVLDKAFADLAVRSMLAAV